MKSYTDPSHIIEIWSITLAKWVSYCTRIFRSLIFTSKTSCTTLNPRGAIV